jgi:hypothetical protein
MSYPNYFTPRGWRLMEGDPETFLQRIADGTPDQTPEVQASWQSIGQKLIEAADLFLEMIQSDVGIVQVTMQAEPELDEHKMRLNFRLNQRTYGASGPGISVNNWAALANKFNEVTVIFTSMVAGDIGTVETVLTSDALTPQNAHVKFALIQVVP